MPCLSFLPKDTKCIRIFSVPLTMLTGNHYSEYYLLYVVDFFVCFAFQKCKYQYLFDGVHHVKEAILRLFLARAPGKQKSFFPITVVLNFD